MSGTNFGLCRRALSAAMARQLERGRAAAAAGDSTEAKPRAIEPHVKFDMGFYGDGWESMAGVWKRTESGSEYSLTAQIESDSISRLLSSKLLIS